MPAPFFFVFRDAGAGNRGVGMPGGIWGFRDAGRCSGFRGAGVSERRCGRVFGGERRGAFGGLPGARKTAGHSEGGRGACGSLCVFRARLVNAWAGSCRELPEGKDCWLRIAGGAGAGCRELGRWEEDRLRVRAWDAWRRFVWQESRWMQGRGCACGVLPVVRESG